MTGRFPALGSFPRLLLTLSVLYVCLDAAGPGGQVQLNVTFPDQKSVTVEARDPAGRQAGPATMTLQSSASGARYAGPGGEVFWAKADKAILELPPGHPLAAPPGQAPAPRSPSGRAMACELLR